MAAHAEKASAATIRKLYHLSDGNELRDGLSHLRENRTLCDMELETEGKRFPVHRVVLAAGSSYFEAMFTRGFKESQDGCIKLEVSRAFSVIIM